MDSWIATGTMLTGIGTLASALAIAAAAWVGRVTLNDLKEQKASNRRYDLAEQIAEQTLLVERALSTSLWLVRSFHGAPANQDKSEAAIFELAKTFGRDNLIDSAKENLKENISRRDKLISLLPMARIYFEKELSLKIDELAKTWTLIETALEMAKPSQSSTSQNLEIDTFLASSEMNEKVGNLAGDIQRQLKPHLPA
jgi:hypothetical protein